MSREETASLPSEMKKRGKVVEASLLEKFLARCQNEREEMATLPSGRKTGVKAVKGKLLERILSRCQNEREREDLE